MAVMVTVVVTAGAVVAPVKAMAEAVEAAAVVKATACQHEVRHTTQQQKSRASERLMNVAGVRVRILRTLGGNGGGDDGGSGGGGDMGGGGDGGSDGERYCTSALMCE